MEYKIKEKLYREFLDQWGEHFEKVPSILEYLSTYPPVKDILDLHEPIDRDELAESQLEWVSLLNRLENPMDRNFFHNGIILLPGNQKYFMDISTDSFPIFETMYLDLGNCHWKPFYLYHDLSEFMLQLDDPEFNVKSNMEWERNELICNLEKDLKKE